MVSHILIVNQSSEAYDQISNQLINDSINNISAADSVVDALECLYSANDPDSEDSPVDLIIMDIDLPHIDGVDACKHIHEVEQFQSIPIIMVTDLDNREKVSTAFDFGAIEFISKPIIPFELNLRVNKSMEFIQNLQLKQEYESSLERKERELKELQQELDLARQDLARLSSEDRLTGISNQRNFYLTLETEWKRAMRNQEPLSLVMMEIDYFVEYNENYGNEVGDECLKNIAYVLAHYPYRPGDIASRFGGKTFTVLLTNTHSVGAAVVAENIRLKMNSLDIEHQTSPISSTVTLSFGIASLVPTPQQEIEDLISKARWALKSAIENGRDQVYTLE